MLEVKFKSEPDVNIPVFKTEGSAGCDVCAYITENVVIPKGKHTLIKTGLYAEVPVGYELQVRPRSGLALKNGVTVLNTPGTIDSDYRGEIGVILINLGDEDFTVHNGDRIAQLILSPVTQFSFTRVEELSKTERGEGGFGHTGVN